MAKEFTFRGKTLNELSEMSLDEFAKLIPSRARRTLKRSVNRDEVKHVMKKVKNAKKALEQSKRPKPIRTHLRDLIVTPEMVGVSFAIHKGNEFAAVDINEKMLGHFFGELVLTRKRLVHGKAGIGATKSSTAITAK